MPSPRAGYYTKSGERVPSVTTVIGRFKESGGLMQWAFQQGKEGKTHLYEESNKAAEAGTIAHALVEAHIKGLEPPKFPDAIESVLEKANNAFHAFLSWRKTSNLEIVTQEVGMVSEIYQFGGTLDAIGIVEGKYCMVDWKTSNAVYQDYLIQLAAYKWLWEELNPDKLITGGHYLCRFAKEHGDFATHYFPNLDEAWEQFLLFRRAYEIDKQLKKRAA